MDPRSRQRRKDFRRREKESIRRQRKAAKARRRKRRPSFWLSLFPFLRRRDKSTESSSHSRSYKLRKKQKKEAIRREKESIRRKTREQNKRYEPLRKRIKLQRNKAIRSRLLNFIKNLFPKRKKKSKQQKFLRSEVRKAAFAEAIRTIIMFPGKVKNKISFFWSIRKMQAGYLQTLFYDFSRNFKSFIYSPLKFKLLYSSINTLFYFILSFLIAYFANQLVTMFVAYLFKIPTELFAYRIYWPLYTYSYLYTRTALVVIFASGPVFSFITAFLLYRVYIRQRNKNSDSKDLFFWGALHSFNLFFGGYVAGLITRTGFLYSIEWLFMGDYLAKEQIILLILALAALLAIGIFIRKQFILSSPNRDIIEPVYRLLYLLGRAFLSTVIGLLVITFYVYPDIPSEYYLLLMGPILMVLPVMIGYNSAAMKKLSIPRSRKVIRIKWLMVLSTIALLIAVRVLLKDGIVIF